MSIFYNVETDRKNPDLQFVQRSFTIIPEQSKTNRFSNLKLSKNIENFVKMHDIVHHQAKTSPKRRPTQIDPRRRATISSISDEKSEFSPDVLTRIVEEQLEAARRSHVSFEKLQPVEKRSTQTKFCPAPRHRVDQIEFPQRNLTRFRQDEIIRQYQKTIRSSNLAMKERQIPLNVKSIDLIEIPSIKNEKNVRLIRYEMLAKNEKFPQIKMTTPLKSIRKEIRQKNLNAHDNPHVSKEDKRRRYDQLGRAGLSNNPGFGPTNFHSSAGHQQFSADFLNQMFGFHDPFDVFSQFMRSAGMDDDFGFVFSPFVGLRAQQRPRHSNSSRRATQPVRLSDNFFSPMRLNSTSFENPFENSMSSFNFAFGSGQVGRRVTKSTNFIDGRCVTKTTIEENGQTIETTEENGQITSKRVNGVPQSIEQ